MPSVATRIPETLWKQYRRHHPAQSEVVHIRLRNGEIRRDFLAGEDGTIIGKVVGGRDGVDSDAIDFTGDQVVAIRRAVGLLAVLGLAPWVTARS